MRGVSYKQVLIGSVLLVATIFGFFDAISAVVLVIYVESNFFGALPKLIPFISIVVAAWLFVRRSRYWKGVFLVYAMVTVFEWVANYYSYSQNPVELPYSWTWFEFWSYRLVELKLKDGRYWEAARIAINFCVLLPISVGVCFFAAAAFVNKWLNRKADKSIGL